MSEKSEKSIPTHVVSSSSSSPSIPWKSDGPSSPSIPWKSDGPSSPSIPWVEKYRPSNFEDIVLDDVNREIFQNIIQDRTKIYFPNLIFYGPPGTGKTTTIINLINAYQQKYNEVSRGTIIHLNASDERGIDIIRNQIYQFVRTNNLFDAGLKFVILDEVDYMTKNAQQALKYLLQTCGQNVRFCLICNYISKVDESLKNEFISIRFNQLPTEYIHSFLKKVSDSEKLNISTSIISKIQQLYQSDIRSMINFIQLHETINDWENIIITDEIYEEIYLMIQKKISVNDIIKNIIKISEQYNTDKLTIIIGYSQYIIKNKPELISSEYLNIVETVIHIKDTDIQQRLTYYFHSIIKLL
jgi:replication factor C subunit 3/5